MFNIKFKFHYLYIENELYLIKIKSKKTNYSCKNQKKMLKYGKHND